MIIKQNKKISKNIKSYRLCSFKFSGKIYEEKYAGSLGTKVKQILLNICFKYCLKGLLKGCQKQRDSISHIVCTVK